MSDDCKEAIFTSVITVMFHYDKKPMFETDQTSRESVKVGFGEYGSRSIAH